MPIDVKGQLILHPSGYVVVGTKRFDGEEAKQMREQYLRYLETRLGAEKWNLHIRVGEYDIEVEEPIGEQHKNA